MKATFKHPTKGHAITVSPSLFNWVAFLFPAIWLIVKRQYGWAVAVFLLVGFLKFMPDEILIVALIAQCAGGFFANRWLTGRLQATGYVDSSPDIARRLPTDAERAAPSI